MNRSRRSKDEARREGRRAEGIVFSEGWGHAEAVTYKAMAGAKDERVGRDRFASEWLGGGGDARQSQV
jgi:hypothetical protein